MTTARYLPFALAALMTSALFGAEPSEVNVKSLAIPNVVGVHKIVSDREYTPLATCFGETCVLTNAPANAVRHATNLVFTANLEEGDQLFVYDHARGGYVTYVLNADKVWEPDTVFAAKPENAGSKDLSPTADQAQAWGYGFWLYREAASNRVDKTIYHSGQVPIGEVSITLAPSTTSVYGKTLVGNPLGVAWNLKDYSIVNWPEVAKNGDHIQLNDADATVYYWRKERGKSTYAWTSGKGTGVIPAGASFWYVRALQGAKEPAQEPIVIRFRSGL